jgi:hypothetical protein
VRADGSLAKGERQRARLEAEGVPFRGARVDMVVAGWRPFEGADAPPQGRATGRRRGSLSRRNGRSTT